MATHQLKSMVDKAKEAINLIKQIKEIGILDNDPSYLEVKEYLNQWIRSDERIIKEYSILFERYGRKATLTLPYRADKTCEFSMKASRF